VGIHVSIAAFWNYIELGYLQETFASMENFSVAQREMAWMRQFAALRKSGSTAEAFGTQNSPESHISMAQKYLSIIPYLLPADDEITSELI